MVKSTGYSKLSLDCVAHSKLTKYQVYQKRQQRAAFNDNIAFKNHPIKKKKLPLGAGKELAPNRTKL